MEAIKPVAFGHCQLATAETNLFVYSTEASRPGSTNSILSPVIDPRSVQNIQRHIVLVSTMMISSQPYMTAIDLVFQSFFENRTFAVLEDVPQRTDACLLAWEFYNRRSRLQEQLLKRAVHTSSNLRSNHQWNVSVWNMKRDGLTYSSCYIVWDHAYLDTCQILTDTAHCWRCENQTDSFASYDVPSDQFHWNNKW